MILASYPVRGLDIKATESIHKILVNEKNRGAGVLLVSEDFDEIFQLCDRVAVMYEGEFMGIVPISRVNLETIGLAMSAPQEWTVSRMRKQRYLTLEKRLSVPFWTKLAVPLASIVAGFLFSAIFLLISGESSIEVYSVMFEGAFGSAYGLSETVVKMIPLMIISVGVCLCV